MTSRSRDAILQRLGVGPRRFVLQSHFQRQKFTKLSTANAPSVGMYSTARRSRSLCFTAIDSLSSCTSIVTNILCYLVSYLLAN